MRMFVLCGFVIALAWGATSVQSQESESIRPPILDAADPDASADVASDGPAGSPSESMEAPASTVEDTLGSPRREQRKLSLLWLLGQGGGLMWVLGAICVAALALAIERAITLRRERLLPSGLVARLGALHDGRRPLDPREAYRACQEFPSPAAQVVRSMLVKVGRPQSELEFSVSEACQREADYLLTRVNTLNLIATVAPLVGLLGTVWGMIHAFYVTTQLAPGQNKAEFLAEGIYTALVTTLGGLVIAIPAAMCAHWFESKVIHEFHRIEELLENLLPQMERFEGRQRITRSALDSNGADISRDESRVGP